MSETIHSYCRICEPYCGMEATVEDGELVQLRPAKDHPQSRGFACPKGIAMKDVVNIDAVQLRSESKGSRFAAEFGEIRERRADSFRRCR